LDDGDIGVNKAVILVTDYALPFFKIGVACYYANNLGDDCISFLRDFFKEKTIMECFINSSKI
jgi:hypothetical protein